jgi:hypothetical protein
MVLRKDYYVPCSRVFATLTRWIKRSVSTHGAGVKSVAFGLERRLVCIGADSCKEFHVARKNNSDNER